MIHNPLLATEVDILLLLLVACLAAIAFKQLQFPYTIGLVLIGLLLGWLSFHHPAFEILQTLSLSHDLILFVFIPPLIFESALNLDSRLLFRNLSPILLLAAPGLLISTAIVGGILSWGTPLTLSQSLLFGSLISATDPVAVIALFKELGAPKQLAILIEGESLFNDATAIVIFNIILASTVLKVGLTRATITQGIEQFLISFIGGILVGLIVGYLARFIMSVVKENMLVLSTVTTVLAYGVFLLAEAVFEVSGVIAVVSAGLMAGWYQSNRLRPEAREFLGEFWDYAAFLANSLIFLLFGLTISGFELSGQLRPTGPLLTTLGVTLVAILLARAVVIFGLIPPLNWIRTVQIDRRYQYVSFWGGLRGAVCLALALSLEADFPNRDLIVALTLGVVLFTLLIPGTTISRLIQLLKLDRPPELDQLGQAIAQVAAKHAALEQLSTIEQFQPQFQSVLDKFQNRYQQEENQAQQNLLQLQEKLDQNEGNLQTLIWLAALAIEQQSYRLLYDQGFMSEAVLSQFNARTVLCQDAVLAGNLPSQPINILPIENQWDRLLLAALEQFFPQKVKAMGLRSQLASAQYEYWGILVLITEQVPLQLKLFAQEGGATVLAATRPCLQVYEQERLIAERQRDEVAREWGEVAISLQTTISNRVASFHQQQAIEQLATGGAISDQTAAQLIQSLL